MSPLLERPYLLFALTIAVYLALILPVVPEHGTSFDEQTDLIIAQSYGLKEYGWLRGINLDAINVRLPMYVSGILLPLVDGNPICWSRYLSCLLSVLTLVAIFVYCKRELNAAKGVLACLILATSPYFLAFSKVAMTEGDVFITCVTAWLLVGVAALRRSPRLGWVAVTGIVLGLALSSKISAVALVPATAVALLADKRRFEPPRTAAIFPPALPILLVLAGIAVIGGWLYASPESLAHLPAAYAKQGPRAALIHYAMVCLFWVLSLVTAYRHRAQNVGKWSQIFLVFAVAITTFFVLPPVHTTNPAIFSALTEAFFNSNASFSWAFVAEAAAFHSLVILLKPSLPIGLGMWLSLVAAILQWNRRRELRVPLILMAFYFLFLTVKMPWAQTYFMMPLFPLMTILLADQLVELFARRRALAVAAGALGSVALATDVARTYPDFHLNGYQWVGERYLAGRSTLGYRSIAQTPSDGVEQVLRWTMEHVPPGERLVYYVHPTALSERIWDHRMFVANHGFREEVTIDEANYVLTTINSDINHGWGTDNPKGSIYNYPYDAEKLKRDFRKIYAVKRAFDIEVAAVWYRKKPYRVDLQSNISGFELEETGLLMHPEIP